jgi:hypothetical protein
VKNVALLVAILVGVSGQTSAKRPHHLVYQFGYNTKAASSGQGTGTTTVDIAPAADGGLMVSATDNWWNSARPRATNTCEVYAGGTVACVKAPYALSPIQLTLFPLLAHNYFYGLSHAATSSWKRTYAVKAAVIPGASGFAGQLTTWNCSYSFQGKGPIANGAPNVLIQSNGTLAQQGGRYYKATSKQRIAYDPVAKVPVAVNDVRTWTPQHSVYNNDWVQLNLMK